MQLLKLLVTIGVIFSVTCSPITVSDNGNPDSPASEDEIREKLADVIITSEKPEETNEDAENVKDNAEDNQNQEEKEETLGEQENGDEEGLSGRFWWLWNDTPKKKPVKIVHGAEILGHKPSIVPQNIKPSLVDHITKPIHNILDKTSEIASDLLNKPHEVFNELGLEKKPEVTNDENSQNKNENNEQFEDFNEIIDNRMPAPVFEEIAFDSAQDCEFNKKLSLDTQDNEETQVQDEEVSVKQNEVSTTTEHIATEEQKKISEETEISVDDIHVNENSSANEEKTVSLHHIKKPVKDLLAKPAEILTSVFNKPQLHLGLLETIKKPAHYVPIKPAPVVEEEIIIKPHKPTHYTNYYNPAHQNSQSAFLPYSNLNKPLTGFYSGFHGFRPQFGFTGLENFYHRNPYWASPLGIFPQADLNSQWRMSDLPRNTNYRIPVAVDRSDTDSNSKDNDYERLLSYGSDFMYV